MDETRNDAKEKRSSQSKAWVGGVVLIALGLLALAGQFVSLERFGLFIPLALGLAFLVWGSAARQVGLLIPGGVIGGIGLGALLIEGPLAHLGEPATAGVFLLTFAWGWAAITLLSALFTSQTHWWPLIPGSIMAVTGGALLLSKAAPQVLTWLGIVWPLGLIALGVYLILRKNAPHH